MTYLVYLDELIDKNFRLKNLPFHSIKVFVFLNLFLIISGVASGFDLWVVSAITVPVSFFTAATMCYNMRNLPQIYGGKHITVTKEGKYWIIVTPWKTRKNHQRWFKFHTDLQSNETLLSIKFPLTLLRSTIHFPLHPWNEEDEED